MAIVLITHDLGVVARMADDVAVMYAGEIVEKGSADDVFYRSAHPYTLGLRAAMPSSATAKTARAAADRGHAAGSVRIRRSAAPYFARCPHAMRICERNHPPRFESDPGHYSRCWLQHRRRARTSIAPELLSR